MQPMNVLLITTDQQRWDAMGYENPAIQTPNLDALAARGIAFERGYTCNPVCTPTRASILTGHYPSKHGAYMVGTSLPDNYPTLAQVMSDAGYFTALLGKAHFQACLDPDSFEAAPHIFDRDFFRRWSGPFYGFEHVQLVIGHTAEKHAAGMHYGLWLEENGIDTSDYFDIFKYTHYGAWGLPQEYHGSTWTADRTIEAIDMARERGKPFFLWSSFQDPHNPYVVPEPWASMYSREDMPLYGLREGEMADKPPIYQAVLDGGETYGDDPDLRGIAVADCRSMPEMDEDRRRDMLATYYGMLSLLDHHVGRIVKALEDRGLMESTIIVFTSDHGEYTGNHGLWGKGLPAYEDVHRVPFLVRHPHCSTPGARSAALQSVIDIVPTFLAEAGIEVPPGVQGLDQRAAWTDATARVRDWAMVEFRPAEGPFMQKTFIDERYKLVLYHSRDYGELYDLAEDPHQLRNLWSDPAHEALRTHLIRRFIWAEMEKDGTLRHRPAPA
jgi:uncharacterized sulfatase